MKFLCLGYYDEKKFDALPKQKLAESVTRCKVHDEELYRGGKLMLVASLAATQNSKAIRPKGGKPLITDGPFAVEKVLSCEL